jgi:hypothetical protein
MAVTVALEVVLPDGSAYSQWRSMSEAPVKDDLVCLGDPELPTFRVVGRIWREESPSAMTVLIRLVPTRELKRSVLAGLLRMNGFKLSTGDEED